jgi:hypothetical protein
MFEKNGDTYIDSNKFTQMVRKKTELNNCLRNSLEECFANVSSISVRKLRALINKLKVEIGCASINFIKEFDVERSMYANNSQIYRTSNMSQL